MLQTLSFITSHPLTRHRPLSAIWRFARWQIESRLKSEVEFDWIAGAKLIVRNGMTGATGNVYCGLHEFADMGFLLHLLRPEDLFVDVGANIGSYTILASKVCCARTIAVEPDPETMEALRRNIAINAIQDRATAIEAAVGAAPGVARFTVGLDTVNHMATDQDHNTRKVKTVCLDDLLRGQDPILIKLDVEGFEADVIAGATVTLRNPALLAIETESRADAVLGPLISAGFKPMYYDPFSRQLTESPTHNASNALMIRDAFACSERLLNAPRRLILESDL